MKLVGIDYAAEFLGLHKNTVLKMAAAGTLPAMKVSPGRRAPWRFDVEDLEAWARRTIADQTEARAAREARRVAPRRRVGRTPKPVLEGLR